MTAMATAIPYGIRDIKLTPYTSQAATTLGGSSTDLPYAQTMKFSETEDFDTLRGDDVDVTMRGKGPKGTWELGAGGLSLEAVAIVTGATLTTTGTTPARVKKLSKSNLQVRPPFKAEGQSISDAGGDVHLVLWRCIMTDSFDAELTDSTFFITSLKGSFLGSNISSSLGSLWDFVNNETAVTIP